MTGGALPLEQVCETLGISHAELHALVTSGELAGPPVTEQALEEYIARKLPQGGGGTCYTAADIVAAGEAAAAALPPLTQDQADMTGAILQPHAPQEEDPQDPAA